MLNDILVRIVGSCGFLTLSAFDGGEAITTILRQRVDVVLMDVRHVFFPPPPHL